MHILSVVGARPQFIKLAPFSAEVRRRGLRETILHTGQHYDLDMSARFFEELGLPEPDVNLGVGSGPHGAMTARALEGIEREILARQPDVVVVFGDTNSTLAGALAAAKTAVFSAHVEAGMRSHDRAAPEEVNRVVADDCCDLLLASDRQAMRNLETEGLASRAVLTGDIMVDALYAARERAPKAAAILAALGLQPEPYMFLTIHRAHNTDDPPRLRALLDGLARGPRMVFSIHPRTKAALAQAGISMPANIHETPPVGYLESIGLQREALAVVTDSGGLQKEAYLLGVPCITLREETEWTDTVRLGWNVLVGADPHRLASALASPPRGREHPALYGDGKAAAAMVSAILERGPR